MKNPLFERVVGVVFALMAAAQVLRLVWRPDILVNGHRLPLWPSVIAILVLGSLSVWAFRRAASRLV